MLQPSLSPHDWVQLPNEVRLKLAKIFNISRSTGSKFEQDNFGRPHLISDGHTHQDLKAITVERMQDFLDVKGPSDFFVLFNMVVDKVSVDDKPTAKETAAKEKNDSIARWTLVMRDIQREAQSVEMEPEFRELLRDIFLNEIPKRTVKRTKAGSK